MMVSSNLIELLEQLTGLRKHCLLKENKQTNQQQQQKQAWHQWLMPVILTIQEAKIKRITVQSPGR
jgi:hypothetical protein